MDVRPIEDGERDWVDGLIGERWKAPHVVSRGRVHRPAELPGLVAVDGDRRVGLLTYRVEGDSCEVVTVDALEDGRGIGTMLLEAAAEAARSHGCRRIWLITTNDNVHALRFYQRRGYSLAALHRDAVTKARRLKPEISLVGEHGIPIRDELELERML